MPLLTRVIAHISNFNTLMRTNASTNMVIAQAAYETSKWTLVSIAAFSLVLGSLIAWRLTLSISRPLKQATGNLAEVVAVFKLDAQQAPVAMSHAVPKHKPVVRAPVHQLTRQMSWGEQMGCGVRKQDLIADVTSVGSAWAACSNACRPFFVGTLADRQRSFFQIADGAVLLEQLENAQINGVEFHMRNFSL
eukprot:gene19544-19981_t